jgi:hypothetical protein
VFSFFGSGGKYFFCFVHMVLIVQYSCAVVSVFGSCGNLVLVLHTYVLRVQYNCGDVLVFWSWREIVIEFTYVFTVQYSCGVVSFFWLWREIVLKMRTHFYKKNLIGLLYHDPIAYVCIYKTKHSFTLYLSILDISLVPHRFAR